MSFGVQSAGLFGTSTSTGDSTSNSLRPFADLDLTEDQRTQIRAIFKTAKADGLSQSQIQDQINAILTPTQLATLQSDLANASSSSTSSTSGATSGPHGPPPNGNPFSDPNGPFANLNLTSDQQTQIAQLLSDAKSQGLSIDQVNAKIKALLTTTQQATFATDLQNLPPPPGGPQDASSSSDSSDPLANLALTSDQKSQIDQILQAAQTNGTAQADVLAQIQNVLTSAQQSAFLGDVQTAQASVSGQSQSGYGGTSASSSTSSSSFATIAGSGLTETDIKNQVAAATSLILQQFASDVAFA
jgi:Spy/CpxP family protein refolding chaperone